MLHVAALAFGLMLPTAPRVMTSRACPVVACAGADPEVAIKEAAARVVKAATRFGGAQGEAAAAWVEDATSGGAEISELIEQQLALFDECMLDDDSGKCKELDAALNALEMRLNTLSFGSAKLDRAAARVRKAARKFGPEQADAADVWLAGARTEGAANPAVLLQAQVDIFGVDIDFGVDIECLLDEDGGSSLCDELADALTALQASLNIRGSVVSTRGLMPPPMGSDDNEGPPPPDGFTWGVSM